MCIKTIHKNPIMSLKLSWLDDSTELSFVKISYNVDVMDKEKLTSRVTLLSTVFVKVAKAPNSKKVAMRVRLSIGLMSLTTRTTAAMY